MRRSVERDERAEQPVPHREDRSGVVLGSRRDVMTAMHARRHEHRLGPLESHAEVAVVEDGEGGIDSDHRSNQLGPDPDEEQDRLGSEEADEVFEHVSASGGETIELKARVVHLVNIPENLETVQANVHDEGNEVEDDQRKEESRCNWEITNPTTDGLDRKLGQLRSEHEHRDRRGRRGQQEPGDIRAEVCTRNWERPEPERRCSFDHRHDENQAAEQRERHEEIQDELLGETVT
jgi:hypothetical protein